MAELLRLTGLKSGYGEAVVVQGVDLVLAFYRGAADMGGPALATYREMVLARLRGGQ